MDDEIQYFTDYLREIKKASHNTVASYHSDLSRMFQYLQGQGVKSAADVTAEALNGYILYLEGSNMAASTISRHIVSMKAFFECLARNRRLEEDPAMHLRAPKVERHPPVILTVEEMACLLEQPTARNPKGYRDKAMLELLYATGMRVSELVHLSVDDVSMRFGWIVCKDEEKERLVPFGARAGKALMDYLEKGREAFLKKQSSDFLFLNCSGAPMSRQGFWKVLKIYAEKAGIEKAITPRMFRHSCAAHMASNGAQLQTIQQMLGHSALTATQVYASFQAERKTEYSKAHPKG